MIKEEPVVRTSAHADLVLACDHANHPLGLVNGMPHEPACHHGHTIPGAEVDNTSAPKWPTLAGVLIDGDFPPTCTVADVVVPL